MISAKLATLGLLVAPWCSGYTTVQLHSAKPELRFFAGSNPAHSVFEIHDSEDLWQWSRLEISLNAFRRSTVPQKQFIIIKIKIFWNKSYDVVIPVNHVTYKILPRDSNFTVDVAVWLKFVNSGIAMREVIITSIL